CPLANAAFEWSCHHVAETPIEDIPRLLHDEGWMKHSFSNHVAVLSSSAMAFTLEAGQTLTGRSWENRLTDSTMDLGGRCDGELEVGSGAQQAKGVVLRLAGPPRIAPEGNEACFTLFSERPRLRVILTYRLEPAGSVLRKWVEVTNDGDEPAR